MPNDGTIGEHIRGVLRAQLVLIGLLEQKGLVGRQEYAEFAATGTRRCSI
jgi:hypothetical protein